MTEAKFIAKKFDSLEKLEKYVCEFIKKHKILHKVIKIIPFNHKLTFFLFIDYN